MTPGESHNEWYQYHCSNIYLFNLDKSPAVSRLSTQINKEISECRPGVDQIGIKLGRCQHVILTNLVG